MSRRIVQRPRARQDVLDITGYLADHSPDAALRFFDAYGEALEKLRAYPAMGRLYAPSHPALAGIRVTAVPGFRAYLVFSRERPDAVEIIRILHGARQILTALEDELPPTEAP